MNNKYIDIKVIRIGLLTGIMGAGLMIYLGTADLGLGNFHGYLFILNYLIVIIAGLLVYKNLAKENTTYFKRLTLGFLIFFVTSLFFYSYSIIFNKFSNQRTQEDKIFVPLIYIAIGLLLSSLLAMLIKHRQSWK